MVCLGLEPGAAWWKAQTNPLSYSGTPFPVSYINSRSFIFVDNCCQDKSGDENLPFRPNRKNFLVFISDLDLLHSSIPLKLFKARSFDNIFVITVNKKVQF